MAKMLTWRRAALLCLVAWPIAAWVGARGLVVHEELARADAIVVLSGSLDFAERAEHAAQLYADGRAPRIILTNDGGRSGWSKEEWRNPLFVERSVEVLRRAGVPANTIEVMPQTVEGTYAEAALVREYAARRHFGSVLFVTSWYHSRRASWTLRRVYAGGGVAAGLEPAPAGQAAQLATWWLRPQGWQTVGTEYPKIVYYWLRYG